MKLARWFEGLWLLALVPGISTVVLDLLHGVTRPAIWFARLVPVLLWLALVAWARSSRSTLAQQVRVELRLAMLGGLLILISSSSALVQDAMPGTAMGALLNILPWVLAVVLPASAVALPMSAEHARGTFEQLMATPSGARVFAIKFALSATLVCLSWLLLSSTPTPDESRWFALSGHLVAVVTVPTWFLLARSEGATLGLAVLVPYFVLLPVGYFAPALLPVGAVSYGVSVFALLPWVVRRGSAGIPSWLMGSSGGGPRRLLFREQRDAMWMTVAGFIGGGFLYLRDDASAAGLIIFGFCAVASVLSASLAFAEARAQGTLEVELATWARSRVLLKRAAGSLLVSVLLSIVAPLGAIAIVDTLKPTMVFAWTLLMLVTWCVAFAASVHVTSTGASMVAGIGAAVVLLSAHVWSFGMAFLQATKLTGFGTATELCLTLSLVVLGVTALLVAIQRFLRADRLQPAVLVPATLGSVAAATLFGVLAAV